MGRAKAVSTVVIAVLVGTAACWAAWAAGCPNTPCTSGLTSCNLSLDGSCIPCNTGPRGTAFDSCCNLDNGWCCQYDTYRRQCYSWPGGPTCTSSYTCDFVLKNSCANITCNPSSGKCPCP